MTRDSSDAVSSNIGLRVKLARFVLVVVIATVFGPLICGGTIFLVSAVILIAQSKFDAAMIGELFLVYVGAAYLAGGVIAIVAGTIIAVVALWHQPTFVDIAITIVVANIGYFAVTEPDAFYFTGSTMPMQELLVSLAFSIFSATICWLLFRRHLRNH